MMDLASVDDSAAIREILERFTNQTGTATPIKGEAGGVPLKPRSRPRDPS